MASTNQESRGVASHVLVEASEDKTDLTPREKVILARVIQGLSSREIALGLAISCRTVEFHRANLLAKYGAKNTAELVRKVLIDSAA